MGDVKMEDAKSTSSTPVTPEADGQDKPKEVTLSTIRRNLILISRGVETNQSRLTSRAISRNTPLRRHVLASVLAEALETLVHDGCPHKGIMLEMLAKLPSQEGEDSAKADSMQVEGGQKEE
ncbi:unnamed protein product, partial [Discosporangium mesarthrocarpum]